MGNEEQISVILNGAVVFRFFPHGELRLDEITTQRFSRRPAIPPGALLQRADGTCIGAVRCVRSAAFDRFIVVFNPPAAEAAPEMAAEPEEPYYKPRAEQIAAWPLREHFTYGVTKTLAGYHILTLTDLCRFSDAELLALRGIGPLTLAKTQELCGRRPG